ncbi:MAG: hypothetical protein ABNG98_03860 [Flavobacterium sp.]|jgi:acyl-CoA thioesterase
MTIQTLIPKPFIIRSNFGQQVFWLKHTMKEEDLKQTTVHEVLLALPQDNIFLATSLIKNELGCSLLDAKKIAENIKKRII